MIIDNYRSNWWAFCNGLDNRHRWIGPKKWSWVLGVGSNKESVWHSPKGDDELRRWSYSDTYLSQRLIRWSGGVCRVCDWGGSVTDVDGCKLLMEGWNWRCWLEIHPFSCSFSRYQEGHSTSDTVRIFFFYIKRLGKNDIRWRVKRERKKKEEGEVKRNWYERQRRKGGKKKVREGAWGKIRSEQNNKEKKREK